MVVRSIRAVGSLRVMVISALLGVAAAVAVALPSPTGATGTATTTTAMTTPTGTTTTATTTPTGTTTTTTVTTTRPPTVPKTAIALVYGKPIPMRLYVHWLEVGVKETAADRPGAGELVPLQPPKFAACVKQARALLPFLKKVASAILAKDCRKEFAELNPEALTFLVLERWMANGAAYLHVEVTAAQVTASYDAQAKDGFKTLKTFRKYLRLVGLNPADIRAQIRTILYVEGLDKKLNITSGQLFARAIGTFRPSTYCQPAFRIAAYCAPDRNP